YAPRLVIEQATEVLVARAVVGGMIDRRVMIGVLRPGEQIQSVEDQCTAGTRHHRADVVTRERSAERDEMKIQRAIAPLVRLRGGDMIRTIAFPLNAIMISAGPVTDDD